MLFQEFKQITQNNPAKEIKIYLPNGEIIPEHFHLTDIGTIAHNFIDCGGVVGSNSWVQIQLWVADDKDHRITTTTTSKIITASEKILQNSDNEEIVIEYQHSDSATKYNVVNINVGDNITINLGVINTTCLEIERNPNTDKCGNNSSCCG
jgi:hypothetical protein